MAPVGSKLSFQQLTDAMFYKATRCSKPSRLHKYSTSDLDSMEQKLQISISLLRGVRNLLQPIHKLPSELLTLIFHETQEHLPDFLPMLDPHVSDWSWLSLIQVCRHWRGLIATCPQLWSALGSDTLPERFLKRSSTAPLKVYLGLKPSAIPERLLESIASESSRFEELHIDSDLWQSDGGPLGAIFQRFTSPAPMLQSLSLVTHGRDFPGGALPHMFSDQMPCLRKLCLKHFTSWPRDYFQGLTHLCLYDQESTRPTMDEFLDFLENSPLLEELALVRAGPLRLETGAQSHIPSSRLVSLPRLRQLDIGEWPSSLLVARFLSHIHLPFQTNMYFWGNSMLNGINPDSNTASGLSLLLPEDISKLENMKHIKKWYLARQPRVILDTPFVSLTSDPGKSGSRTLYMYGTFSASQLLPAQLFSRYPVSEVESLTVRDSCTKTDNADTLNVEFWKDVLKGLPVLRNLEILSFRSIGFTRAVVAALMPPNNTTSQSFLTCPELTFLTVEHDVQLPAYFIRTIAEARAQFTPAAAPLQKVRVLVCEPDFRNGKSPRRRLRSRTASDSESDSDGTENGMLIVPSTREEEEYRRHAEDDRKVLEGCVDSIKEVEFEYDVPLSVSIVPETWPTRAFQWTRGQNRVA